MSGRQLLPLSGVLTVLLILAAFIVVGETPEIDDSAQDVLSYYEDNDNELQWGAALLALGSLFFVLFSAAVASLVRGARDARAASANVTLAGGIVFAVGVTIFAGLAFTAGDAVDNVQAGTIETIHALENDMFFTVAVGTSAFLLGAGVGTLRTGALPNWLAWAAIVIGVLAVTPVGFFAFLALGIWTLIVSVMLFMREREADEGSSSQGGTSSSGGAAPQGSEPMG